MATVSLPVVDPAPAAALPLPVDAYRQAVDQADIAISITDTEARFVYVNATFSRLSGYLPEEVVGRKASILSNHTTPPEIYADMWAHLVRREAWTGPLLNRRKDGSLYLAELTVTPVVGASGEIEHYLGMHRDLTQLHSLEQQVRQQKELIESVIDAAPIAFALLDNSGRVRLDNQEYKKLVADLGSAEPAHTLLDLLQSNWRSALATDPQSCRRHQHEIRVDRPGRVRWFSCSVQLLQLGSGGPDDYFDPQSSTGLLLVVSDIAALRNEQERARISSLKALLAEEERISAIRESLSAAVFRLEEPVNVMSSAVKLLQRRDPTSATLLEHALAGSRSNIDVLRQSIPQGSSESMVAVNLNEALRDVLEISTTRLLVAGISVNWDPALVLPNVLGRPLQLRLMFKAILDNAIEALDVRGWHRRELVIRTRETVSGVRITIADSGQGIPEELLLRAFEPFFTTKSGTGKHLGTGLSRTQDVVAAHGGLIDLEPVPEGGCCVSIDLPLDGTPL